MLKTNDQFVAGNKAAVDSLLTVVNASLNTAERLAALNLNTARAFLADGAANVSALLAVKDPQSLIALQKSLAKPALEQISTYSRSVYEILSQSSNGLTQLVEGQVVELKKNFSAAVEQSLKNAPAGSEAVVTAIKSGFAAADSAYENITKATKQASAVIEANVATAKQAAVKLVAKAA
ncbi:MAG: granule-associated-like protein [Betaproteobacteria bacterium HGW-Betaproteobacteria-10]|jgi:phasin family protein|nr:MAG: granule-associated-like protein [Betaproteobacteria bacterium HGW-Betaproteobacteria-10]